MKAGRAAGYSKPSTGSGKEGGIAPPRRVLVTGSVIWALRRQPDLAPPHPRPMLPASPAGGAVTIRWVAAAIMHPGRASASPS